MEASWRATAALIAIAQPIAAQEIVFARQDASPNGNSILVWDSDRQVVVAHERDHGGALWEWDGQRWRMVIGAGGTYGEKYSGAYDSLKKEFVVFGTGPGVGWDGGRWNSLGMMNPLQYARIVFDSARGRLVEHRATATLFMREWDGSAWVALPAGPPYRAHAAIAYDPVHQRTVIYGGTDNNHNQLSDCWSWDGTSWTQISAASPPGPRSGASLGFDAQSARLVLYGGYPGNPTTGATATWELIGSTWTQIVTPTDPGSRLGGELVFDGTGMLMFGGYNRSQWRLVGNQWQLLSADHNRRELASLGYDEANQELVLFGGGLSAQYDETWTYDGTWHLRSPAAHPSQRTHASMSWSAIDNQLLLFGGSGVPSPYLGDTWLWDGTNWTVQTPTTSPSPRYATATAQDPLGGVFLFGGVSAAGAPEQDQWYWDGTDWTQVNASVMPGTLLPVFAGYDPVRNRTLLLGRTPANQEQLWEWNGVSWTQVAVPTNAWGGQSGVSYNPQSGRMLITGAWNRWEYDALATGQQWFHVAQSAGAGAHQIAAAPALGGVFAYPMSESFTTIEGAASLAMLTDTSAQAGRLATGCSSLRVPTMSLRGRCGPAYPSAALHYASYLPNTPSFVAVGVNPVAVPVGGSCELAVGSQLAGFGIVTDANGEAELPLAVPASNALLGYEFVAQGASLDPINGPLFGMSLSDGLVVRVGY